MTPRPNNERIVQLLYRRLKKLEVTADEYQETEDWINRSASNRKIFESLSDEDWLKEARKRYYAPGKEAGLAQLREQLFKDPIRKPLFRRLLDFLVPRPDYGYWIFIVLLNVSVINTVDRFFCSSCTKPWYRLLWDFFCS